MKKFLLFAFLVLIPFQASALELGTVYHPYQSINPDDYDQVFELMNEAGFKWMRFLIVWHILEPEKGKYNWTAYDNFYERVFEKAEEHGIKILGEIGGAPGFANGSTTNDGWVIPDEPEAFEAFINHASDFANAVSKKYKDHITRWEVWNEPNLVHFWHPQGKDGLQRVNAKTEAPRYVQFLGKVSKAIKAGNPDAEVMNGGVSNCDLKWLEYAAKAGLKEHIDYLAYHLYYPKKTFEKKLEAVLETAAENGLGEIPFVITEMGWSTTKLSEEEQLEEVQNAITVLEKHPNIPMALIYELRDEKNNEHGGDETSYGLVNMDWSPKKSFSNLVEKEKKKNLE